MPTGLMIPQIGSLTQKQKRVIILLCFAAVVLFLLMMPAFAQSTTTTIETEIKKGTQSIYDLFKAILAPIAVVMVVWNVYKALFLGDKGMESAKKGVLIILCIVAVVYLAPVIVTTVRDWFSGIGDQGVFTTRTGTGTGTGTTH